MVADAQGAAAGVAVPAKGVALPTHTLNVPVIDGNAFTVTITVAVFALLSVYVISVVPAAMLVTRPVLSTVATDVTLDVQGVVAAAVPDPVNCVVPPAHTTGVPVIVGKRLTVMIWVVVQPLLFV